MRGHTDPSTATGADGQDGAGESVTCPYCGSSDTVREHPKGPSLCRSMYYCNACYEPFEAFG